MDVVWWLVLIAVVIVVVAVLLYGLQRARRRGTVLASRVAERSDR